MTGCKHITPRFHGMCTSCGTLVGEHSYAGPRESGVGVSLDENHARALHETNAMGLLRARKLCLILDLDNTLLHATDEPHVADLYRFASEHHSTWLTDLRRFTLPSEVGSHFVKFRPGLFTFLKEIHKLFDLHIYTMGSKEYANQIALFLDPDQKLFGNRIVSRDPNDPLGEKQKDIKQIAPFDDSMVLIVDDRDDVWRESLGNLVRIKPYFPFRYLRDTYRGFVTHGLVPPTSSSPSPSPHAEVSNGNGNGNGNGKDPNEKTEFSSKEEQNNSDSENERASKRRKLDVDSVWTHFWETDQDRQLDFILDILKKAHREFFQEYDSHSRADVKDILNRVKRKVLAGVGLVFSGLYPLGTDLPSTPEWRSALEYGAVCCEHLEDPRVTHVLAARDGTNKVIEARRRGLAVVSPRWLEVAIFEWRNPPLDQFLELPLKPATPLPIPVPVSVSAESARDSVSSTTSAKISELEKPIRKAKETREAKEKALEEALEKAFTRAN